MGKDKAVSKEARRTLTHPLSPTTQLLEFTGDEAMEVEEQPTWMSFADDE